MNTRRVNQGSFQELLAAIYLSSAERCSFFLNPEAVLQAYHMDLKCAHSLNYIQKKSIDFYSRSLKDKRFQEIMQFIPLTKKRCNKIFYRLFDSYFERWIPAGPKKHVADLISFANHLIFNNILEDEARDCLLFETTPWIMNFKISKNNYTYRHSQIAANIVQAHRNNFFAFQMAVYKSCFLRENNLFNKFYPFRIFASKNLGIYFKLPFISKIMEWYIPLSYK